MREPVSFAVAWAVLAPVVSREALTPKLVLKALDSMAFWKGKQPQVVRNGTLSISIEPRRHHRATLLVFIGQAAVVRAEVEKTPKGWCVSKLGVRSTVHRLLEAACLQRNIHVVADGTLHALQLK